MPGLQQLAPAAAQLPGTAGWPGRAAQGRARLLRGGQVCAAQCRRCRQHSGQELRAPHAKLSLPVSHSPDS